MELILVYSVLVILLCFVLFYDVKQRSIHAILPVLIFITSVSINIFSEDLLSIYIVYNLGFLSLNIIGLWLYFSVKKGKLSNPIDKEIGLGDILMFVAITPLYNLKTFALIFSSGLVFSLVLYFIVTLFKQIETIPLAGYLALFLVLIILIESIFNIKIAV